MSDMNFAEPAVPQAPSKRTSPAPFKQRCVFQYRVDGDLRFISHNDTIRMFRRACARACLKVRYTDGFNPRAKLMIPLPRPVGVASDAECLIIEFSEPVDPNEALLRLGQQMPEGITLYSARNLLDREEFHPRQVRYQLDVSDADGDSITAKIAGLESALTLPFERKSEKLKTRRTIDLKPYVESVRLEQGFVEFSLRVTNSGSAKPAEIAALLAYDPETVHHRIRRLEVEWSQM